MLNTGIFSDKLKIAKIVPVYKKDDEHLFNNYQPISLLPLSQKYLKKLFLTNYKTFLLKKKIV